MYLLLYLKILLFTTVSYFPKTIFSPYIIQINAYRLMVVVKTITRIVSTGNMQDEICIFIVDVA